MAVIHYWYDPLCGWCYGAAPLLQVAGAIPGLRIALHGGGLFSGAQRQRLNAPLRQHILVSDATVLAKYQAKGCEIIRFAAADVAAARPKAMAAWRTATKGDALATKILDSQVAFMKELGLIA